MKIYKTGIFKNQWMCLCGNKSTKKGFYPSDAEGSYQRDIFGRGRFYACAQCGRMIEPQTLEIVGLSRGFRLRGRELRDLILCFQEDGVQPVGVGFRGMYWSLPLAMYRSLGQLQLSLP